MLDKEHVSGWFKQLQDNICNGLEQLDGKAKFKEDRWERKGGGGGRSRVIENGTVFEKGGVNFSAVYGQAPDFLIKEARDSTAKEFFATGVSLVIHPQSPMVPIIHMNVRFIALSPLLQRGAGGEAWFGGGIDLTPIYIVDDDAKYFHKELKSTCDKFSPSYYPEFKKWADDYFFIKHRNETRGVGGIFFDRLMADEKHSLEERFEFVKSVGETFLPAYSEIVKWNQQKPCDEKQKQWQLIRRGRYAEFNLVYDRGTKFGLETEGRTESILMSLPPLASWIYNFIPPSGSEEERTQRLLKKGIEWASTKYE